MSSSLILSEVKINLLFIEMWSALPNYERVLDYLILPNLCHEKNYCWYLTKLKNRFTNQNTAPLIIIFLVEFYLKFFLKQNKVS